MSGPESIRYKASQTGIKFHNDDSFVRAIVGCVGGGKTSMVSVEILRRATMQAPFNNVRRFRCLCIRNTYAELKSTLIRTVDFWLGSLGKFTYDSPIKFNAYRQLPDGTMMDLEIWFLAQDQPADVKKLRSLECTMAVCSEFSELHPDVLKTLKTRVGRFPAKLQGGASWSGIVLETNPYSVQSPWYDLFNVDRPRDHALFEQPGALIRNPDWDEENDDSPQYLENPLAENIEFLPGGFQYYHNIVSGNTPDYIAVYVLAEYGQLMDGKPVYSSYSDKVHASRELIQPIKPGQLVVGCDWGLSPAAVITQLTPHGSLQVLDEISPQDVTIGEFLDEMLVPLLQTRYRGSSVLIVGDPTGQNRNPLTKKSVFDEVRARNLASVPSKTNDILMRREAVGFFLARRNGFLLSPNCVELRAGFLGGYHFAKSKHGMSKPLPEKNKHSHTQDALQYAAVYYRMHALTSTRRVQTQTPIKTPYMWA